ncbi:MAG: DUF2147 domain-containing protein [Bacteroidota bacterium]
MNRIIFGIVFFLLAGGQLTAQSIFGKWKTVDDETGETKSIVDIYENKGKVYGKVKQLLEKGRENALCAKCEGDLKDQPIVGMNVVLGLKKKGDEYEGGKLFDPEKGKFYRGKIWLNPENPDKLMVRGYVAFLYRTQTWLRVTD